MSCDFHLHVECIKFLRYVVIYVGFPTMFTVYKYCSSRNVIVFNYKLLVMESSHSSRITEWNTRCDWMWHVLVKKLFALVICFLFSPLFSIPLLRSLLRKKNIRVGTGGCFLSLSLALLASIPLCFSLLSNQDSLPVSGKLDDIAYRPIFFCVHT